MTLWLDGLDMISPRKRCKFWRNMEVQRSHPAAQPQPFSRDDPGETSACVCHQWFNDHWMHIKMQWQEKMPSSISSTLFQPMKAPCFVEFLGTPQMPPMDQESISECHRMLCSPHFWHFHYDFLRYDGAAAIHCTISGWREGHGKMWKQSVFDPWILATHCNFQAESRKKSLQPSLTATKGVPLEGTPEYCKILYTTVCTNGDYTDDHWCYYVFQYHKLQSIPAYSQTFWSRKLLLLDIWNQL